MSKDSKSEIPWSPRLAHELRTLQFAREFVDSIKRVKCDQQEHKERALEIAQGFVDSLPRLADCSEKRQQNQAGLINGRDRRWRGRCMAWPRIRRLIFMSFMIQPRSLSAACRRRQP